MNHFDHNGNAVMVDVSSKPETTRSARATGKIMVGKEVFHAIKNGNATKGDVLGVARVAAIMGVKKTWDMIPMCHPLLIQKCTIDFDCNEVECSIRANCQVKVEGKTGVEMEALHGVTVALLTIYDMCKAMNKSMNMEDIHLLSKEGGKSGKYVYDSSKKTTLDFI